MVSTPLKNISQNGNLPQKELNIKTILKPPPRKGLWTSDSYPCPQIQTTPETNSIEPKRWAPFRADRYNGGFCINPLNGLIKWATGVITPLLTGRGPMAKVTCKCNHFKLDGDTSLISSGKTSFSTIKTTSYQQVGRFDHGYCRWQPEIRRKRTSWGW